jgi:malonyl CoA-acyl carrier protein transacylase
MTSTALLFPGQGSHAEGMDEPYREHPLMKRGLEVLGFDPFARLQEGTAMQQPALLLVSVCALDEEGPADAAAAAGHSLGEYSALVAAGALDFEAAVALVAERGAAMADAATRFPGGMVAMLGGDGQGVRALAARLGLTVANDNAPGQLVLSGADDAITAAEEAAREMPSPTRPRARRLDVAGAFLSPLMEPAAERLRKALAATEISEPRIPVYANGTAAPFTDIRAELAENLLRPVRWRETLLALRAAGIERFAELGPGAVLTGLVKRTLGVRELAA